MTTIAVNGQAANSATNANTNAAVAAPTNTVDDLQALAERVDKAAAEARTLEKDAQTKAFALKSAVEAFHKLGLTRIIQKLKADPRGKELLFELVDDPALYALFAMHGLVRADLGTRVSRVIDMVRPYMQSHGGDVELVDVSNNTAYIKLHGACNGCSMSSVTLRNTVEDALREHVPEVTQIEVVPNEPTPGLISLDDIGIIRGADEGWVQGPPAETLAEGKPYRFDLGEVSVLIIRTGGELKAYRNACAHLGLPIDGGMVDATNGTITCPWHGWSYDCLSGECFTAPAAQLEGFPLRVENGVVWVRPS